MYPISSRRPEPGVDLEFLCKRQVPDLAADREDGFGRSFSNVTSDHSEHPPIVGLLLDLGAGLVAVTGTSIREEGERSGRMKEMRGR